MLLVNISLRKVQATYFPVGSLSVVTVLRKAGFADSPLYNTDWFRPSFEQLIDYLKNEKPDMRGRRDSELLALNISRVLKIWAKSWKNSFQDSLQPRHLQKAGD